MHSDGKPRPGDFFDPDERLERFSGLDDPQGPKGQAVLKQIAAKIAATRHPGSASDIPAGVTYLTQFVIHDLDFPCREGTPEGSLLDLGILYGDGPRHDAFCYQVPGEPTAQRHLLRLGRTRPTANSPAWGAARDLPRAGCPHLDAKGVETRSEVLVPNSFSDTNMLLGQVQGLWALAHNAIATVLAETRSTKDAFEAARRINRGIYRDVVINDVLGSWLMPGLRPRYAARPPRRAQRLKAPREFLAGVGRLGHSLVREIYALNDQVPIMGLRDLIRQTSTGRPHDMPLTEAWLVDFGHFFAIGSSEPQKARALGPHVARPFGTGAGLPADAPAADSLVLRDLVACTSNGLASVRSLIARARRPDPDVFDGCFAQDESHWIAAMSRWLADAGVADAQRARLAADPPLTLFLMLEAEADTGGKTLGALGSILMGEALADAVPAADSDPALEAARSAVFGSAIPASMAELICFLQRHYKFAEGARLHAPLPPGPGAAGKPQPKFGDTPMLDTHTSTGQKPIPRIDVADYIEMGRLVAQWALDPATRPTDVETLKDQLNGIAVVPDRIKSVEFVQSTLDHLILRLPVREMIEESLERMTDPMGDGRYPLPQFYSDHYRPGFGPVMTPLDTLLARVGDYTIAQCR